MNARFDIWSLLVLIALAAVPILLWRASSAWRPWVKVPVRLFATLLGVFVLWLTVANTVFFLGLEH